MTQYALERGINVFMEKPPAITLAQLDQLKQAVYASKAKLGLCYQNRYNPSYRAAKEFIASGAAGKVLGARGLVTWNRPAPYYTQSEWRGKLATEGGGVLINQAVRFYVPAPAAYGGAEPESGQAPPVSQTVL